MIQLFCAITGLVNFVTCFFLAVFLYYKNKSGLINKLFALWSLSVALWSLGYFVWLFTKEYDEALLWTRIMMVGAIIIPATYIHFTLAYLNLQSQRKKIILFCYFFSAIYLFLNFTPLFIRTVEPNQWFDWWPKPGLFYHLYQAYFVVVVIYSHYLLFKRASSVESGIEQKQLQTVAWGTLIAYMGGSTNFFLWYGIPIPPIFNFLVLGHVILIAYAILSYKLWDLDFFIRRSIVFAGVMFLFLFVFSCVTYVLNLVLSSYTNFNTNIAAFVAFAIGILAYKPIENYLTQLTDKYLFQKKYDYQKLLKDASRGISKIKSLEHLLSLVVHFITMRMRVTNAAVLSIQAKDERFKLAYQRGFKKNFMEYFLDFDSELIRYLSAEHEAIDIEMVKDGIEAGNKKIRKGHATRNYNFDEIKKTMEELETSCCIPSFLGKELRNILILGDKKSGDHYVEADLNVLYTLAQESAIAIENARLYDEAINKTKELSDINSQLEYAKDLLMKALNDTEVANKQLQDTQAQLIHEQKMATLGRLAASVGHEVNNPLTILSMNVSRVLLKLRKNPDLKVTEIMDTFDKMEQNIGRIKAVVNTLTGLLKKSEKGKFEPLSLKLILEETLPLVQFQTYLDNLTGTEVDFEVPGNLPLVRGDLERLQEVFLNLFINAYHAMEGKQYRRIRVTAESDPTDKDMVSIRFQDNGKGMDDETRKKIFNYRFTTKAPGKGSGLGLYMCKYIVELHGGSIYVHSKLGEGTTFVINLPSTDKQVTLPEGDMHEPPIPRGGQEEASA